MTNNLILPRRSYNSHTIIFNRPVVDDYHVDISTRINRFDKLTSNVMSISTILTRYRISLDELYHLLSKENYVLQSQDYASLIKNQSVDYKWVENNFMHIPRKVWYNEISMFLDFDISFLKRFMSLLSIYNVLCTRTLPDDIIEELWCDGAEAADLSVTRQYHSGCVCANTGANTGRQLVNRSAAHWPFICSLGSSYRFPMSTAFICYYPTPQHIIKNCIEYSKREGCVNDTIYNLLLNEHLSDVVLCSFADDIIEGALDENNTKRGSWYGFLINRMIIGCGKNKDIISLYLDTFWILLRPYFVIILAHMIHIPFKYIKKYCDELKGKYAEFCIAHRDWIYNISQLDGRLSPSAMHNYHDNYEYVNESIYACDVKTAVNIIIETCTQHIGKLCILSYDYYSPPNDLSCLFWDMLSRYISLTCDNCGTYEQGLLKNVLYLHKSYMLDFVGICNNAKLNNENILNIKQIIMTKSWRNGCSWMDFVCILNLTFINPSKCLFSNNFLCEHIGIINLHRLSEWLWNVRYFKWITIQRKIKELIYSPRHIAGDGNGIVTNAARRFKDNCLTLEH